MLQLVEKRKQRRAREKAAADAIAAANLPNDHGATFTPGVLLGTMHLGSSSRLCKFNLRSLFVTVISSFRRCIHELPFMWDCQTVSLHRANRRFQNP